MVGRRIGFGGEGLSHKQASCTSPVGSRLLPFYQHKNLEMNIFLTHLSMVSNFLLLPDPQLQLTFLYLWKGTGWVSYASSSRRYFLLQWDLSVESRWHFFVCVSLQGALSDFPLAPNLSCEDGVEVYGKDLVSGCWFTLSLGLREILVCFTSPYLTLKNPLKFLEFPLRLSG